LRAPVLAACRLCSAESRNRNIVRPCFIVSDSLVFRRIACFRAHVKLVARSIVERMPAQPFLVLSRAEVEGLVSLRDAISAVEEAFRDLARGEAMLFPVIRERIDPYGG